MTESRKVGGVMPSEGRVPYPGKFSDRDYHLQAEFRSTLRRFLRFSEEQAMLHGITPQQHLLLLTVRGHAAYPQVSVGDVADSLQIRHHSASLLIDRCFKRGLLTRTEDPEDRRRALIALTEAGQRVLDEITEANREELGHVRQNPFYRALLQVLRAYGTDGKQED